MNKVIIMGNNTKDIELRKTNGGKSVCEFTIAVNEKRGDTETTEFIDCRAWDKSAESISKYLTKGKKVLIEGKYHTETYEKMDGSKVRKTLVIVYNFWFVSPKEDTQNVSVETQNTHYVSTGYSGYRSNEDTPFESKTLKIDEEELPFY